MTAHRWWHYLDPQKVTERKESSLMMQNPSVRLWAKRLAAIYDRSARHEFLMRVPEEYR